MVPVLTTARLTLRGFTEADLDAFAAMQADAEVMRHLGTGQTRSRAETWQGMAGFMGQWALRGHGLWALEHQGRFIGRAGILNPEGWPAPELAYALARPAWGQGLAFEAAEAALRWARAALPQRRIVSYIRPANGASRRLAARLGGVQGEALELLGAAAECWDYPQ
ncbi:GNAT family N-acetyltransferase [Sediminicoccus sp. KRV36]|uniref:GNAT family N-acetyltransferase n=1 Tax=Sediminicoccus sp. KRV36 TaxID=3133721 RepID=UPI00200E5CAF|nr:GNAT family N-acetyltransferase [Sediminicoccus rosea]UPY38341.1 GNAT family N-acetyltransferase [Sediminicoccus rosea]